MARLRDGQMITCFGLVFAVKVSSEPVQTHAHGAVIRFCAVCMDGTATQGGRIAEGADSLMSVAGLTALNGGFRLEVITTKPLRERWMVFVCTPSDHPIW